ncbi:MAG: DUF885 domain-containing protein [Polyangiaceae bacterium]|nr:DUF885 domain-containing protein [Polyangiaceae bacterium]
MDAPSPLADEVVRGVQDPALRAVLWEFWEWAMRWAPVWATTLGDHRYDDRLEPRDAASLRRYHDEHTRLLDTASRIDRCRLGDGDAVTWMALRSWLGSEAAQDACHFHEWWVSPRWNLLDEISRVVERHPLRTPSDGDNLIQRLHAAVRWIDDSIANLGVGLTHGRVAARESIRLAIAQLDTELARSTQQWAMTAPARAARPQWPVQAQTRFSARLHEVVAEQIRPALCRLRVFLAEQVLPLGRTGTSEGIGSLPDGETCYLGLVEALLGSPRAPEELHALGLAEIARTDGEIAALGARLFGSRDLGETLTRLRTDRSLYFADPREIVTQAEAARARAGSALPTWFGRLPRAPCVVREVPAYEAPYMAPGYYSSPNYDGSKPGEYFVNTHQPETRPRFELEVLTWHESIPGHHLQRAMAQELDGLALPRKLWSSTAHAEGWALYAERLADEMGLYSTDLDRLGMHGYDAWRAARVVVDTGIHWLGWTRDQALRFMLEHTASTPENLKNEVDRYVATPALALVYKVGQLKILELRDRARAVLGEAFDVRDFHDVVLGSGALPLPVLEHVVRRWLMTEPAGRGRQ